MGKKKPFVKRNDAGTFTYQVVHRSHRDPALADNDSSDYVLQPVVPRNVQRREVDGGEERYYAAVDMIRQSGADVSHDLPKMSEAAAASGQAAAAAERVAMSEEDRRRVDLAQLGIYYDDDYDYMQHLRETGQGGGETEVVAADPRTLKTILRERGVDPADILDEVAARRAAPQPDKNAPPPQVFDRAADLSFDPRFDLDPDIVAALDDALDFEDPNNILDDDFVLQAQQSGDDYDEDEDSDAGSAATLTLADEEDRWRAIGHGSVSGPAGLSAARQGDDNSSMGSMGHGSDDRDIEEVSVAQSRFTEYSMTSSILPRSEHQVIHNEHFEAMYAAYDDSQLGALDEDHAYEDSDVVGTQDIEQFDRVLDQFLNTQRQYQLPLAQAVAGINEEEPKAPAEDILERNDADEAAEEDEEEETMVLDSVAFKPRNKEWDCESILSTRSTLYNHPTVIDEKRRSRPRPIQLHPKTGLPLEAFARPGAAEEEPEEMYDEEAEGDYFENRGVARDKHESAEDKRARKQNLKEEKRLRRQAKKATKEAFKAETNRQNKLMSKQSGIKAVSVA